MVRDRGFEPLTPSVSRKCSTTELTALRESTPDNCLISSVMPRVWTKFGAGATGFSTPALGTLLDTSEVPQCPPFMFSGRPPVSDHRLNGKSSVSEQAGPGGPTAGRCSALSTSHSNVGADVDPTIFLGIGSGQASGCRARLA